MSKSRRTNGHSNKEARHVRIYHWIMHTLAGKSLSANATAIYIEMASRYAGINNGQIPYSVRDAAKRLRIGTTTAAGAIKMLQDRGFIVAVTEGAFSRKNRHATEWRLTEFHCNVTNALASKEFARWSPKKQNTGPVAGPTVPARSMDGSPHFGGPETPVLLGHDRPSVERNATGWTQPICRPPRNLYITRRPGA
jgi:hypothetical protein